MIRISCYMWSVLFIYCLIFSCLPCFFFFFFNAPAPTEIYTLSLHDALPIYFRCACHRGHVRVFHSSRLGRQTARQRRSEEHTSELQSHHDLVCRLLLEKKKTNNINFFERTNKAAKMLTITLTLLAASTMPSI